MAVNRAALLKSIVLPAKKENVMLERALVREIRRDVSQEIGGVPLAQFALAQLWQTQSDETFTIRGVPTTQKTLKLSYYRKNGGLMGG
jgi:hypothetical protein